MAVDLSNMNLEERTKYLELKARYGKNLLPWYKKWWGITILVVFTLVLIFAAAAGFYIWQQMKEYKAVEKANQQAGVTETVKKTINPGTGYFLGSENATLTIVEFSDFACPYCDKAYPVLRKIVARYPDKVKIVFRDLPLHEHSVALAMGARCAGDQGKFWEMHDQLFANQNSLTGTSSEVKSMIYGLAGTIGLNAATFDACYQSKKYLTAISTDYTDASTLKLQGTPSWFLNNKLLTGYIPEATFLAMIDKYFESLK